jgi:prophage regulatory protein
MKHHHPDAPKRPRAAKKVATPQQIAAASNPDALIAIEVVEALTGFAASTLRKWIRKGRFPAGIRFSRRGVRWRASGVHQWVVEQGAASSGAVPAGGRFKRRA